MGAKRQARKEFAKEQEFEKLREQKERKDSNIERAAIARKEKKDALKSRIDAMSPGERTLFLKRRNLKRIVIAGIIATFIVVMIVPGGSESTDSSSTSSSKTITRSYPVEYVRSFADNPATRTVVFKVTNDGTQAVKPTCQIRMEDASGTYKGYDIFDLLDPIAASASQQVIVQLTVTKEGAAYANQFSGECTADTTDSGTNAGKGVEISDIVDFSATEGSEGWYWGASFKANQAPMTQMDCVVKALDKNGKVIGSTSYRGNTLNNGAVIGYGSDAKSLVDSTKSMVQSIKSFDVKCTL